MKKEALDGVLKEVIGQAQEENIPVPDNILKKVEVNSRPKKRFGCCKIKDRKYHIEISEFVLKCEERYIRETLAHEVLHTCPECQNHGKIWKEYAERMNKRYGYNIKRVSSFEEMGLETPAQKPEIKYIIKCRKCGKEYPRQRFTCVMKKIKAYRCGCGGELVLMENPGEENIL
ncbi:MAG TPA: SprT-like domain-containing protein [Candidatus Copromorpha excrementigallinarum]|uniref:SprT-like domain-containing protein n=1 Tax=Candidatus Allocopromorpha excrementigallinarum TaxID=2840742 RepID=A0A9D1I3B8_9FIRM|nr:SprT-like domain-containing protein [Candidatus Copromorpha excrementigallinarum]